MKPQPLVRGEGIRMLIYGVAGAGKTRLIGTGPKTLIIRPPTDATDSIEDPSNVREMIVYDHNSFWEAFQYLQQGGHSEFEWVWFDSISLFQDHGLDDVFQAAIDRKPERAEYGPDKGEFGINMGRLAKWCRDMVGLANDGKFNFGITAHPSEWMNPVTKEEVWAPWVQGKGMSMKICGYMNIVAYLQEAKQDDGPSKRVLLSDSQGFYGKDQFNCFPELKSGRHGFIDPTIPKITSAIKKARPEQAKSRPARKTVRRPKTKKRS